jgi:hypothetical protein
MLERHRHSGVGRLLACASAAMVLAAAYANSAQASGLEGLAGQQGAVPATVGTATSAVNEVTATVTGTVETATSAAAPVSTVVDPTVTTAAGTVANVTQTVSDTAQTASTAVDQTIGAAGDTVQTVVSSPTVESAASAVASTTPAAPTSPSTEASTALTPAGSDSTGSGTDTVRAPAPTSEPVVGLTGVGTERIVPSATAHPARPAASQQGVPRDAVTISVGTAATPYDRAAVQRPLDRPIPSAPSSSTALLGGSGASTSFVFATLLGALLVAAFGRLGSRLRVRPEVFRPPDVLFQLERPG